MNKKDQRIFTHPHPIHADKVDSVVLVPVVEEAYSDEYDYEEIPSMCTGANTYRLCASPLIVFDLNVDDVVLVDEKGIVINLIKDSGKFGFKVGLQVHYDDHDELFKYDEVVKVLKKLNCDIEYYSHHLIAIVANNRWKARKVQRELLKLADNGVILGVETNRS